VARRERQDESIAVERFQRGLPSRAGILTRPLSEATVTAARQFRQNHAAFSLLVRLYIYVCEQLIYSEAKYAAAHKNFLTAGAGSKTIRLCAAQIKEQRDAVAQTLLPNHSRS
jgi:hypothetical protein